MRYLNRDSPPQSPQFVPQTLKAPKANWLQNAFLDAGYALGGRCHGFGPSNPCPVADLAQGETIHVEFNNGWFSGEVLRYSPTDKAALVRFDVDNTTFHVKDRIHNFIAHQPPQLLPPPPLAPKHLSLAPTLLHVPPPLPLLAIPYQATAIDSNEFRHLFRYPANLPPLEVSALKSGNCQSIVHALDHPASPVWLWAYLDGSWDPPLAGSAAVMVWPDDTVLAMAVPCPYKRSRDPEFWSFVQCIRYLSSISFSGKAFFCIDNSQLVDCVDWSTPFPHPSDCTQSTWQTVIHDLLRNTSFVVGAGWLKSHVGFPGNEVADGFAKYTAHSCTVAHSHRQPLSLHSALLTSTHRCTNLEQQRASACTPGTSTLDMPRPCILTGRRTTLGLVHLPTSGS